MKHSTTFKGLIFRIYNSGAYDKVVHLIDKQGKRKILLAKGIRKPNSRKSHSVDLGNYVEVGAVEGYNIQLAGEIKLLNEFSHWKNSFLKITLLQYLCEIIDKFAVEDSPEQELFNIFYTTLKIPTEKSLFAASAFSLVLLNSTGHLPDLNECINTSDKLSSGSIYASEQHIGYVSDSLSSEAYAAESISDRIFKTQRYILNNGFEEALKINLSGEEIKKLFTLHMRWIQTAIDTKLKSKDIILNLI